MVGSVEAKLSLIDSLVAEADGPEPRSAADFSQLTPVFVVNEEKSAAG